MITTGSVIRKRVQQSIAAIVVAAGTVLISPATDAAAATARNGVCENGEFCVYYLDNYAGSVSDFSGSIADYGSTQPGCYEFRGSGYGQGQCVKNNARSVWNRSTKAVRVYFNSNYGGASQLFSAGQAGNLNSTLRDNNASHRYL